MNRPLQGKRIVVTRARDQAGSLAARLEAEGATPVPFPTIRFAPMPDPAPLDAALDRLGAYDLLVFTSANGVRFFMDRAVSVGKRVPEEVRIAAVGTATAKALEKYGLRTDLIPDRFTAEALADALGKGKGRSVLLPQAEIAREALANRLAAGGAQVNALPVYRTLPAQPLPEERAALDAGVDALTFASPSSVRAFFALLGERAHSLAEAALVACIGPVTAAEAEAHGLPPAIVPEVYTTDGLVDALVRHFAETHPV